MSSGVPIPTGAADLTADWLTAALADISGGAKVLSVIGKPIGTGQIADSIRLAIEWDRPTDAPSSLVTKVTSANEDSRNAGIGTRTYEVEVGFYRDLAPSLDVHKPGSYWQGYDPSTGAYAVVLDDMAPAEQGDQMKGCSVDEAALALDEAALLHRAKWGDANLSSIPWLDRGPGTAAVGMGGILGAMIPGFLERYESRMTPEVVELVQRYADVLTRSPDVPPGPRTVVHNDFRNDNLLFGGPNGRVCVLDWQTVAIGHGVADASYFLGGSLLPDDRRANERDLLRRYHERLTEKGVDLSWDDCWYAYRRYAYTGLTMAIFASLVVTRTDRGDEMFIAMADRAGQHMLDLETEALLLNP